MATATTAERYQVYVWEFPVRLFHWTNVLCVVSLCLTGYGIGHPISLGGASEASQQYWFGTMRFIHFTAAYVWICVAALRIYWGFVGNQYVRHRNFLPLRREQWREINAVMRMDILQVWKGATFSVGHNPLAGLAYMIGFLGFLFQTLTGFGMYAATSQAWFANLFVWVVPLMGGDHATRLWHHSMIWFFVVFGLIHVYLSAYHDYVEATGTMSSMIGGWKFVRRLPPGE
jgi:Ni/Fe-hydrogenase 1 B-type cytochrome subunit